MRIEAGARFVEDPEPMIPNEQTRDADLSPLAGGEYILNAAIDTELKTALGASLIDDLRDTRRAQRRFNVSNSIAAPAEEDVLFERAAEETLFRWQIPNQLASPPEVPWCDIDTVEEDTTRRWALISEQESSKRALPAAGRSNKSDTRARRELEIDVAQHGSRCIGISEGESLDDDVRRVCTATEELQFGGPRTR
jgi:hypothetical protein